jgi:hypothetical protein
MEFSKHSFSNISRKQILKESLELLTAPAIICLLLGLIGLGTGKYGDKVIITAVTEFLQLIGLKITLYTSIIAGGICLVLAYTNIIKQLFGWVTASIAKCGFAFSAVISGVYLGLAIPVGIESWDYNVLLGMLLISAYFAFIQIIFVCIAELANYEFKKEDLRRKIKYINITINMQKLAPWTGLFLIISGALCFYFELWPSVFGAN